MIPHAVEIAIFLAVWIGGIYYFMSKHMDDYSNGPPR